MQVHLGAGVFANPPSGARHHRRAGPCPLVPPEDTAGASALVDSPRAQTAHSQVRAGDDARAARDPRDRSNDPLPLDLPRDPPVTRGPV